MRLGLELNLFRISLITLLTIGLLPLAHVLLRHRAALDCVVGGREYTISAGVLGLYFSYIHAESPTHLPIWDKPASLAEFDDTKDDDDHSFVIPVLFGVGRSTVHFRDGTIASSQFAELGYAPFVLLALILPTKRAYQAIKRRRKACKVRQYEKSIQSDTRCPKCGYDLRASENRCPECGTPFVRKTTIVSLTG